MFEENLTSKNLAGAYIPWKMIKSWSCLACARCCEYFNVTLSASEYATIYEKYGPNALCLDELGNICLKKINDRCIFQDNHRLCSLQNLYKPLACKVWPFIVYDQPKPRLNRDEAYFNHKGQDYFIYVEMFYPCKGINKGNPEDLPLVVAEIIEIWQNPEKTQIHSASKLNHSGSHNIELLTRKKILL